MKKTCFDGLDLDLLCIGRANQTQSILNLIQSNTIRWIEFDLVRFVRLNSICSEIELTESLVFD